MTSFVEMSQAIETALAGEEERCAAEERELHERQKALRRRRGIIGRRRRALERFSTAWRELPEPEVEWPPRERVDAARSETDTGQQEEVEDVAAGG